MLGLLSPAPSYTLCPFFTLHVWGNTDLYLGKAESSTEYPSIEKVSLNPKLTDWFCYTGQPALGMLLSLLLQCWDCRWNMPHTLLLMRVLERFERRSHVCKLNHLFSLSLLFFSFKTRTHKLTQPCLELEVLLAPPPDFLGSHTAASYFIASHLSLPRSLGITQSLFQMFQFVAFFFFFLTKSPAWLCRKVSAAAKMVLFFFQWNTGHWI